MKHPADILKVTLLALVMLATVGMRPTVASEKAGTTDSIEVSLLTCAPHSEIYSLYGHTAIRFRNKASGVDWTFNYGVFNFHKPYFALRFAFGLTDYELGVVPYRIFEREYKKDGRQITEQVINMTPAEKRRLYEALMTNYMSEERVYRYNYFYNNCTTKARDMIEKCVYGRVVYHDNTQEGPVTYREMIHHWTEGHHWAAFGNDLCLGVAADQPATPRQQQFLPYNLRHSFASAQIVCDGVSRPLVKETRVVSEGRKQEAEDAFPLTPLACASLLLAVSLAAAIAEWRRGKTFKALDFLLLSVSGLAGVVVFALLFSEHPTTSTNLQVLLLNPMPLIFLPAVLKGKTLFWRIYTFMIMLFLVCGIFQDYAEGMEILALCLLSRCLIHLGLAYKHKTNKA